MINVNKFTKIDDARNQCYQNANLFSALSWLRLSHGCILKPDPQAVLKSPVVMLALVSEGTSG
jgi:hypothetical protein